jgi:hypothetical protein
MYLEEHTLDLPRDHFVETVPPTSELQVILTAAAANCGDSDTRIYKVSASRALTRQATSGLVAKRRHGRQRG